MYKKNPFSFFETVYVEHEPTALIYLNLLNVAFFCFFPFNTALIQLCRCCKIEKYRNFRTTFYLSLRVLKLLPCACYTGMYTSAHKYRVTDSFLHLTLL